MDLMIRFREEREMREEIRYEFKWGGPSWAFFIFMGCTSFFISWAVFRVLFRENVRNLMWFS